MLTGQALLDQPNNRSPFALGVRAMYQSGFYVDDRPETLARNREAFGMKPEQR